MNCLRRIIPWAFEHEMHVDTKLTRWDRKKGACYVRLVCQRCGFTGEEWEISDKEEFVRAYHKRGCRGAR